MSQVQNDVPDEGKVAGIATEPGAKRPRSAERAREAILNAAEAVFAERGFAGARFEAIARASGYSSSLLTQYFVDKVGLYVEVIRRADREVDELFARVLEPLLANENIAAEPERFRAFLEATVRTLFDYLVEHPNLHRIFLWEMAEGWRTYPQVALPLKADDVGRIDQIFRLARSTGLLRSKFPPLIQLTTLWQVCQSYFAWLPAFRWMLPNEDLRSVEALERAHEYVVGFVVAGMLADSPRPPAAAEGSTDSSE